MEGGAESKGGVRHGGRGADRRAAAYRASNQPPLRRQAAYSRHSCLPRGASRLAVWDWRQRPELSCLALARARLLQPGAEWRVRPVRPPSLRHPRVAPHALHPHSGLAHDALHPRRALRPPPRPGAHASPPRQVRAPCAHPAKPRLGSCGPPTPTPGRPALRPCFSASAVLIHSLRRAARTRVCLHARTHAQVCKHGGDGTARHASRCAHASAPRSRRAQYLDGPAETEVAAQEHGEVAADLSHTQVAWKVLDGHRHVCFVLRSHGSAMPTRHRRARAVARQIALRHRDSPRVELICVMLQHPGRVDMPGRAGRRRFLQPVDLQRGQRAFRLRRHQARRPADLGAASRRAGGRAGARKGLGNSARTGLTQRCCFCIAHTAVERGFARHGRASPRSHHSFALHWLPL